MSTTKSMFACSQKPEYYVLKFLSKGTAVNHWYFKVLTEYLLSTFFKKPKVLFINATQLTFDVCNSVCVHTINTTATVSAFVGGCLAVNYWFAWIPDHAVFIAVAPLFHCCSQRSFSDGSVASSTLITSQG